MDLNQALDELAREAGTESEAALEQLRAALDQLCREAVAWSEQRRTIPREQTPDDLQRALDELAGHPRR